MTCLVSPARKRRGCGCCERTRGSNQRDLWLAARPWRTRQSCRRRRTSGNDASPSAPPTSDALFDRHTRTQSRQPRRLPRARCVYGALRSHLGDGCYGKTVAICNTACQKSHEIWGRHYLRELFPVLEKIDIIKFKARRKRLLSLLLIK